MLPQFWKGNKEVQLQYLLTKFLIDHSEYTLIGPKSDLLS